MEKSVALLLLTVCTAAAQITPLLSTDFRQPVTVGLQPGMRSNGSALELSYPGVPGQDAGPTDPYEIHLAPAGVDAIIAMWATGNYSVYTGPPTQPSLSSTSSVVKYGTSASSLSMSATGSVETYNQIYNVTDSNAGLNTALNYTSPFLHNAVMTNLTPGTVYYYQVGDGTTYSAVYNFTSLVTPGPTYPQRVILIADMGASQNSTVTTEHAVQSASETGHGVAPVVHYIGDYTYADTWASNGTNTVPQASLYGLAPSTYQPVWDLWQKLVQPLVAHVPMMGVVGNHEVEQQLDANLTTFASVQARWKVPSAASNSNSYFHYSMEYGPVHAVFIANYEDYTPGSNQWNWLYLDLFSVNRTKTPWIIVNFHNPWMTTDTSYKDFEDMRISLEPLLYSAGADLVFNGHVHAYERGYPVYNYQLDPCGITHITIGDAGNAAGLSFLAKQNQPQLIGEDIGGGCPNNSYTSKPAYFVSANPSINDQFKYYKRAYTFQANGNTTGVNNPAGFCYNSQPMWSAYREPSFGHGTLDILNGTTALWQWHRNQDSDLVTADAVYIVRNTTRCMNKMYPNNMVTNGGMLQAS